MIKSNDTKDEKITKSVLKQKGFIIVLAICIIAISGILFATMTPEDTTEPELTAEVKTESPDDNISSADLKDIFPLTVSDSHDQTLAEAEANAKNGALSKADTSSVPQNMQKAEIKILKPMDGEIIGDFVIDKLTYNKTLNMWQTHNGIDIAAGDNAQIKAALAGEVTGIVEDPSLGLTVTLAHSGGIVSKYCGLADTTLSEGNKVQQGDIIGSCSSSPFEAHLGAHLHFEVWENGNAIDPKTLFQ